MAEEQIHVLPADEPPKNGEWVDVHEVLANPTPEEVEAGRVQGLTVREPSDDDAEPLLRATASTAAVNAANALARHIRDYARVEVSVELVVGRPTSLTSDDWYCPEFRVNFGHHIVSRPSATNPTPGLALVKRGRSDVPGPLCNGYGGGDLTYRIICFGLANHPGAGGPWKLGRGGFIIPKDSARPYAWGTEWEGGIEWADWTRVLKNPRKGYQMTMLEMMGRVDAAINTYTGWPRGEFWLSDQGEHKDPWAPTRKVDRKNWTRRQWQDNARKYVSSTPIPTPSPGEDLPVKQADFDTLFDNWIISRTAAKRQWDVAAAAARAKGQPEPAMSTAARAGGSLSVLPWWQRLGRSEDNMHSAVGKILSAVQEADMDLADLQEDVDALLADDGEPQPQPNP